MKKMIKLAAAMLLAALLAVETFAVSRGEAYIEHNGYYDEEITTAAPGDTIYIALVKKSDEAGDYEIDSDDRPDEAEIRSIEVIGISDDEEYDLIKKGELDIVYEEVEDGVEWYFAELPIDDVDLDDYPDDGYYIEGTLRVTRKSGKTFSIALEDTLESISFSDAGSSTELKKTAQLFRFKSGKDIELEFSNGKGRYEGRTRQAIDVFAGMSHAKVREIVDENEDAELEFYIGNGAEFKNIRDGKLIIEADDDSYLYELDKGRLRNRSSYYDEDEEAYVIETDVLGSYVVSDMKLSTSYDYEEEEDEDDEDDGDVYVHYEDEDDGGGSGWSDYDYVLVNPATGVEG